MVSDLLLSSKRRQATRRIFQLFHESAATMKQSEEIAIAEFLRPAPDLNAREVTDALALAHGAQQPTS